MSILTMNLMNCVDGLQKNYSKNTPGIDWQKGYSGLLLTDEQAEKIEQIVFRNYI